MKAAQSKRISPKLKLLLAFASLDAVLPAHQMPDVTGTWTGTAAGTQSECLASGFNGAFESSITVEIVSQEGMHFSGEYTAAYGGVDRGIREIGMIRGTITPAGLIEAQADYTDYIGGTIDTKGHAKLAGTLLDRTIDLKYEFQDYVDPETGRGDTCRGNGRIVLVRSAFFPDYVPTDSARYCKRTYVATYGVTGTSISNIVGTIRIPYRTGDILAMQVQGMPFARSDDPIAIGNDGTRVVWIAAVRSPDLGWAYVGRDCQLTAPAAGWSLSGVSDGMIIELGSLFAVKGSVCEQIEEPGDKIAISIQPVTVQGTLHPDTVIVWWLDVSKPFQTVHIPGDLGIQSPNSADTGSHAVTEMLVFARDTGLVAWGDVEASTGLMDELWELSRVDCSAVAPVLFETGVVSGASFLPGIASGAWVTVQGMGLALSSRGWQAADFVSHRLPTQLDGVSVEINGKLAFPCYVSPTQVNALAPDDPASGPVAVVVTTPHGRSAPVMVEKRPVAPGWFMFDPEGRKYIAAVHPNGAYVGKPGLYASLNFRPAKPGDIVSLYGTGFGPTAPPSPAADFVAQPSVLRNPFTIRIGGVVANVTWAGLVGSGLNQLNVVVPDLPDGDQPVVAETSGFQTQQGAFITVQR